MSTRLRIDVLTLIFALAVPIGAHAQSVARSSASLSSTPARMRTRVRTADHAVRRVPLTLLSASGTLRVSLPYLSVFSSMSRSTLTPTEICETPCTLLVPPTTLRLTTSGDQLRTDSVSIDVPAHGGQVILRRPHPALGITRLALLIGGAATVGAGVVTLLDAAFADRSSTVALESIGGYLVVSGLISMLTSLIVESFNHATADPAIPL